MKVSYLLIPGFILFLACNHSEKKETQGIVHEITSPVEQKDSFTLSEVIPVVGCNSNASLSYALYLPKEYNETKKLPCIIFVDPHGDGSVPLNRYFSLAEKFGVILMGSNDSKNGMAFSQTTAILQSLIEEAVRRFHADERQVSFAGFSGGAKAVLVAASETPALLSIIYCGAGIPEISASLPPALAITGLKDMNYTEVIQTDQQMENMHLQHALIEWNGKHEWSDSATFLNAFYWIKFRAIGKKLIPEYESMVQAFIRQNSKTGTDPLQEEMRLKKIIQFLGGVADISGYVSSLENITKQKKYQTAREKQQNDFGMESRMKQNYLQCINLKDPVWWRDEVVHLRSAKANPMNDRILGYISLACYSYSANALKQQDLKAAEKYLTIYALVDRENPDRAYIQACLYGLMQNKAGTLQFIGEAIHYGFKDEAKLMSEPALAFVRNTPEFNELIREIK